MRLKSDHLEHPNLKVILSCDDRRGQCLSLYEPITIVADLEDDPKNIIEKVVNKAKNWGWQVEGSKAICASCRPPRPPE